MTKQIYDRHKYGLRRQVYIQRINTAKTEDKRDKVLS